MLKLEKVFCGYNGEDAVKGVSFELGAGECVSVIGPNGCGKTTLLRAVSGLLPYRGNILLGGKEISSLKRREISSKMALMTQQNEIYFDYSVYDTVALGRYLHRKKKIFSDDKAESEAVLRCLEDVDLLYVKDRNIRDLSGGQLQRVFLARTFAQEPDIIFLDEPTNHLDIRYQIELIERLKAWVNEGERAVIGVFHDLNLAMSLSPKTLLLNEGRQVSFGKTKDILQSESLQNVYGFDIGEYMRKSMEIWK